MTTVKTSCRGCHGGCVQILTVENGRVVKVRPDPDAPLNRGRACVKGLSIVEQMYHPDRLLYPMRRKGTRGGGTWERISWDAAYDLITEKMGRLMRDYGPECVALTTGTGRHHLSQFWRFGNVLGTPNVTSSGALVCLGPRVNAAMFTSGVFGGVDYYGSVKPAGILIWGANPAISGADGELQFHIKDAVKAGTPLIVVDPQPTELARKAALWLRVRPGTDGALALGILNIIFSEELYDRDFMERWTVGFDALRARCAEYGTERVANITRVPADQIVQAARMIASIKPLSLEWGCAIEQSTNSFQTCRAIYIIPAVTGNYDVPGGFVESLEIAPTPDILLDRLSPDAAAKCISGGYPLTGGGASPKLFAHPHLVFEAMRTGKPYPIRGLFSHANNSLLSMPDSKHVFEGLSCLDFFVYMDFFMTPTAELADVVLPAAMWPELDTVYCMPEFGEQALLCQKKVVQVGECISDEEFFFELSRRMGLDYGAETLESILDGQLEEMGRRRPEYAGIRFQDLKDIDYIEPKREYRGYERRRGFHTPSGKYELYSQAVAQGFGDPLPFWSEVPESPVSRPDLLEHYPLILTTGGRIQQYFISNNRQIRSLRRAAPFPLVRLHPDTAAQNGIADGDWVYIETLRGRITQKAKLVSEMDPQVVNCEMGWWYPEAGPPGYGWEESNANILTVGGIPHDPFNGAYQLRALMCKIEKNEACTIEARYHSWINGVD